MVDRLSARGKEERLSQFLATVLVGLCTTWILVGLFAVARATRSRGSTPEAGGLPGITVLKPLAGADADLEANLRSFFEQDYPRFQIVAGAVRSEDPAIAVVERLSRAYPHVDLEIVVHPGGPGRNPKVSNLMGMVGRRRHDLVLISDSSVRAPRDYLRDLSDTYRADPRNGLVTNLFAGVGEKDLGAALENVQLNGFVAQGAALPTLMGDAVVVGKSMLFSMGELERLGGLRAVSDMLAEDFLIGKMFQHAGFRVRLGRTVLPSVNGQLAFPSFLDRQLRWSMLRIRLRGLAFVLEPITSPLAILPFAWLLFGPWALGWMLGLLLVRDVGGWVLLRGTARLALPLFLGPLRELSMLLVWVKTPFRRHIAWRGNRVRIGAGTMVFLSQRRPEALSRNPAGRTPRV